MGRTVFAAREAIFFSIFVAYRLQTAKPNETRSCHKPFKAAAVSAISTSGLIC